MTPPGRIDLRADPDADLGGVVKHLRAGGVIAYPTETVYGFGTAVTPEGLAGLRAVKPRDPGKPYILLIDSIESVAELAWTDEARELARIFWPGALTLVLRDPRGIFPAEARSGVDAVAIRLSPQPVVARLLRALGAPITSTSANVPRGRPATSGAEAEAVIRELGAEGVVVLDGGTLPESAPSTIIDCTTDTPAVLREGSVPVGRLRCALPEIDGSDV